MTVTSDLGQYAKSLNIFSTVVGENPGRRRCTAVVGIHSIQYNVIRDVVSFNPLGTQDGCVLVFGDASYFSEIRGKPK